MNQDSENQEFYLSWQGQVTGPRRIREIKELLKLGEIHSLYKIQNNGQWILLRDHLAEMDRMARQQAVIAASPPIGLQPPAPAALGKDEKMPEDDEPASYDCAEEQHPLPRGLPADEQSVPPGLAIASFVLSLFFFVPFLNGITWLLALIFGHLALSNAGPRPAGKAATLALVALWISYVEIGFFLTGLAWAAVTESMPMMIVYLQLHFKMLGNAIGALIGASVLMLAIKIVAGHLLRFAKCYVAALLPSALNALGMYFLQERIVELSLIDGRDLLLIALLNLVLFVGQIFLWSKMIRLTEDEELGVSRAALVSLLYTAVFIFVGLGYAVVFAIIFS